MTKDAYYEMCEQLGTEPDPDEVPIELDDFPILVQDCFILYAILPDCWDSMAGQYLGKDYSIIFGLFKVYGISTKEEQLMCISFLQQMDSVRGKLIGEKIKQKTPQK